MSRVQIVLASTLYGVATVAAAVDDDQVSPADRRLLVITNNSAVPELTPAADRLPGFAELAHRFDQVVSFNEAVAPLHPTGWAPRAEERPLWERYLRDRWDIDDQDRVSLLVESIQVEPARAVAAIFAEADIDVYADGLMSFGPTRNRLEASVGSRIDRLLYVDLVPGLTPMLLSEWQVRPVPIDNERVRAVFAQAAAATKISSHTRQPVSIMLGQYLAALGVLTPAEEQHLHLDMLHRLADRGERNIIFKPHPSAPRTVTETLQRAADDAGLRFHVLAEPVLAETLYERLPVSAVISCFSTGLMTAAVLYDIEVLSVGTELVLNRLMPYQNSNRVPVMIIDRLVTGSDRGQNPLAADPLLPDLVAAVGYVMQPVMHPERRATTAAFLTAHYARTARYFRRRRLGTLDLPGQLPRRAPSWRRRLRRFGRAGLRRLGLARVPRTSTADTDLPTVLAPRNPGPSRAQVHHSLG